MATIRSIVDRSKFNSALDFPYELRIMDFEATMQDVDFFYDVNLHLVDRGLERLDDMLRPAIMSGVLSDMVTARQNIPVFSRRTGISTGTRT